MKTAIPKKFTLYNLQYKDIKNGSVTLNEVWDYDLNKAIRNFADALCVDPHEIELCTKPYTD